MVLFNAVKLVTFPFPLAARPIAVLELVQVYVAPAGLLLKLDADTEVPGHTVEFPGTVTIGNGLMLITAGFDVAEPHALLTTRS